MSEQFWLMLISVGLITWGWLCRGWVEGFVGDRKRKGADNG